MPPSAAEKAQKTPGAYLSSTIVKEAAYYGSDIGKFVTPNVEKAVNEKYALIRQKKDPET